MTEMLKSKNLQKHGLAVEAIMRALCGYLKEREKASVIPTEVEGSHSTDSIISGERDSSTRRLARNDIAVEFNEEEWAIVGLLHDADYELVEKDPSRHTLVTEEKLRSHNVSDRVINGIKAHHEGVKPTRDNLMESSVYAADELSGLITAVALVRPDKKLSSVTVESVMKKFPQKSFAAGAKREQILACEKELNIPLVEFVGVALKAMQGIAVDLGL